MCLELLYANNQILKTAAKLASRVKVLISVFRTKCLLMFGGWGKVKHTEEEVTEAWEVLHRVWLHELYCLPKCTGW